MYVAVVVAAAAAAAALLLSQLFLHVRRLYTDLHGSLLSVIPQSSTSAVRQGNWHMPTG